jgi:hypothetical protein
MALKELLGRIGSRPSQPEEGSDQKALKLAEEMGPRKYFDTGDRALDHQLYQQLRERAALSNENTEMAFGAFSQALSLGPAKIDQLLEANREIQHQTLGAAMRID